MAPKQGKSLLDLSPELCKDWWSDKNTSGPENYNNHSKYNAWWKCKKCTHEWQQTIQSKKGRRCCPNCRNTSAQKNKKVRIKTCKPWTLEEVAIIKHLGPYYLSKELEKFLPGRSRAAISTHRIRNNVELKESTISRGSSYGGKSTHKNLGGNKYLPQDYNTILKEK